jgi:hypothetical protein
VSWQEAEGGIAQFVAYVADWLRREELRELYPWVAFADPLRQQPLDSDRSLELFTGRSRTELLQVFETTDSEVLKRQLGLAAGTLDPGASPVTQVIRDLPPGLPAQLRDPLVWLREATVGGHSPDLAGIRAVVVDATRDAERPEDAGYAAAQTTREALGLNGQAIADMPGVLTSLGMQVGQSEATFQGTQMLAGMKEGAGAATLLLQSERMEKPWARRFEVARALGHVLLDPWRGGAIGASSSPFALASRRRRSGAFAAELLLPYSALVARTGGVLDQACEPAVFRGLMTDFGIGAGATANHLWNHRLLSSTGVRDDLVETYSAEA